ncbi:hypothetical protein LSCM1_00480 [Leishmania martiniquensis]|uniref:Amino acid transporter transmembrane domain-containing protein n=1 Tax=Leishmania martiniquensis TaxID=1580590 RepID=A0A836K5Y8_9TRYP|nr:hypothetical protein LSCM1_00480 [Leishmania martiniquensis]
MRSSSVIRGSMRVHDVRASQRRSFAGRISHHIASRLSLAGPPLEVRSGTVTGTIINTLCSVIGAGVLSMPLALYFSSIIVGTAILLVLASFAGFSVYCLVVGCDATGRYSLTEVMAFALYPPQLWEEYLHTHRDGKGAVRAQDAQRLEGQQHMAAQASPGMPNNSSSRSTASNMVALENAEVAATGARMKQHRGPEEGMGGKEESTEISYHRHQHGRHRHDRERLDGQPQTEDAGIDGHTDHDSDTSFLAPPTSMYTELRDAYAREEWRRRRHRRIITTLMELIVFCSNYGTLVIYSKVIADSMPPVVFYVTRMDGVLVSKYFWLLSGGAVFFVLSSVRNMEELKWTSLLGFLTILYIVLLIAFRYHTQQQYDYPHVDQRRYGEVRWLRFSSGVLQAISTFALALSYHYNVPYFYKELQNRRPYCMMQSLSVAFPIIIACYAVTGIFGYLTFGDQVAAPKAGGNIVSNYPKGDLLMNIGRLGLFAHFACVYPVLSICTRRSLHRLTMIFLTWTDQSALMREAARVSGAQLTEAERGKELSAAASASSFPRLTSAHGCGTENGDGVGAHAPGETSPLLQSGGSRTRGYEVFKKISSPHVVGLQRHGNADSSLSANASLSAAAGSWGSSCTNASSAGPLNASQLEPEEPGTVDVDRDVGSPDQTTTLAIVVEAAFLVCTTVLIAATVPGIDFVIQLIGTLFSVFVVMVAPGMVGWCVFSPTGPFGSASAAAAAFKSSGRKLSDSTVGGVSSRFRLIRLKQFMCLVNAVLGLCVTCIGISMLAYNTV